MSDSILQSGKIVKKKLIPINNVKSDEYSPTPEELPLFLGKICLNGDLCVGYGALVVRLWSPPPRCRLGPASLLGVKRGCWFNWGSGCAYWGGGVAIDCSCGGFN